MAYKFGQFRKEQYTYSNYVKQLEPSAYKLTSITSSAEGFEGISFNDISIQKSFTTADGNLFLRFSVMRFTRETGITIKLTKENTSALSTNNTQIVGTILVPAGNTADELSTPIVYDIVIAPNETYSQCVFAIDRDDRDFTEPPRKWTADGTFKIISFGQISNIIDTLDIEGVGRLKQIGVQSRPGLEMCIGGEMIRVGRSGIYEVNHGVDINFIGFMPEENDHFIMDYQY